MKRIFFILLISLFSLLLYTGCSNQGDEKIVLRFAYASNSQPVKDAMAKFGELLSEKTNGEVTVDYFPDSQLGGERELVELTQTGAVDLTKVSGSALESFSEKYSIFGLPYLFDDKTHFYNVMDSDIVQPIYNSTEKLGFVGLTYYDSGQRSFYTTNKPIEKPSDLKGMKIRVMQSQTAIKMVQLLGGSPTPMDSGEVYTSLQQGILDGAENNEFALTEAGHAEVTKYYSYDEHTRVPDILIINKETLDRLTEDQRQAVYEAAKESTEFEKVVFQKAIDEAREKSEKEFGVVFNQVDKKPFQEAVQPLHEEFKNKDGLKEIYEEIVNMKENK
ncbi:TRAP transporter substrate-binding protein [Metabacillus arenae]|uniref:TRAP transporter substrate-binding protein n=1 Tax=Metabacillus arenae TaxID=2771434 RepID=A0A926S3F2_9BACI|nr:TRAP transporter substrate-binding protein [Metabacillus arenae]MBD1382894.1 TRAP transporter substrate-binding protein [Metabacillus arenae]